MKTNPVKKAIRQSKSMRATFRAATLSMVLLTMGCATTHPQDPFEHYNRVMFSFNYAVDEVALKPAAQAYSTLPSFVQAGIYNFFGNLEDVRTALNNVLQGKLGDGFSDAGRVVVNSTIGLGGLFDIATEAGLYKNREDFGQTLGKWGLDAGPYVVLPLLGPSTLRDTIAVPIDFKTDPWLHVESVRWRNIGTVVRAVDQRAVVLDASQLIDDAALDRYQFVRDAYLQRRRSQVFDGEEPAPQYPDD